MMGKVVASALCQPAIRTVVIDLQDGDGEDEWEESVYPVVAIRNTVTRHEDSGIFEDNTEVLFSTEYHSCKLQTCADIRGENPYTVAVVVCAWPEEEDDQHLGMIIKQMKVDATDYVHFKNKDKVRKTRQEYVAISLCTSKPGLTVCDYGKRLDELEDLDEEKALFFNRTQLHAAFIRLLEQKLFRRVYPSGGAPACKICESMQCCKWYPLDFPVQ